MKERGENCRLCFLNFNLQKTVYLDDKGSPNREVILGNFPWGEIRIATFHIADHFFYVKKSVNLRKDDTKNHDTRTVLLLGVLGEIYKRPGAKSSLLCFETEKSWILCLRVRPGVGESRLWRKQMGGAPPPKSVSLHFLSCIAKAFFKNMKIGTNQRRHLGFTEEGTKSSWVWLENTQGTLSWR